MPPLVDRSFRKRIVALMSDRVALTKSGLIAFSESLRQEMQPRRARVSVIEPGIVQTEIDTHLHREIRDAVSKETAGIERLQPEDVADAIA